MNADLSTLRRLTGATHTKKILKGLLELGIPYKMAGGRPVVLVSSIERVLGLPSDTAPKTEIDMAARLSRLRNADGTKTTPRRRAA